MLKRSRRATFGGGAFLANLLGKKKKAFTLAETLIALVIIGVVSALTLPTLLTKINDTVTKNKIAVFERKLSKGTDLLNIEYGIGPYYNGANPSYEFAQALSKHLKIVTICDKDNLKKCLPYDKIQTDVEPLNVSDLKTGKDISLNEDNYVDTAGIVLGDGTPLIFSWNKNCPVSDPDAVKYNGEKENARSETTNCISGFYDLNGSKGPNKFGKDIIGFNGVNLGWLEFAGLKITKPEVPTPLYMDDYCTNNNGTWEVKSEYQTKYNIKYCCTSDDCMSKGDYWAGAMVKCKDMGGHLATLTDLATIATYLYDASSQIGDIEKYGEDSDPKRLNTSKLGTTFAGLGSSWNGLWSSSETRSNNKNRSYARFFTNRFVSIYDNTHSARSISYKAVCVK